MSIPIILASGSSIRAQLLQQAQVPFQIKLPRIDEEAVKDALLVDGASPRDIADCLAEHKARKISDKSLGHIVIGCDQVLEFDSALISKPDRPDTLADQLRAMSGREHLLWSAAVICEDGRPVWRHVGKVRLTMHKFTEPFLTDYITRNWEDIRHCVGGYQLEAEGVRLFSRIDGNYFDVLGMPLLEILGYLATRGVIET